jgi:hypothetical protein
VIDRYYTVVVAYPARLCENYSLATYIAYVKARDSTSAWNIGHREAWQAQPPTERGKMEEWVVLLVFSGFANLEYQK